jgi:protoporphyrinogen oxidase
MPEAWRAMYAYSNAVMEPWDGPAALAMTDGRWVAAGMDRNGLRPLRYVVTGDGLVIAGSEIGMVPVDEASVREKGRLGPGQMWEACRDRIRALGGRVLMQHHVSRIEVHDGRAVAVHASGPGGEQRIPVDHVISTMPVRSLTRALTPPAPAPVRAAAEGLRYRDFLVVALMVDQDNLFPDNWIYVHTPGVQVGRIQNFGNWSKDLLADGGGSCLGMEYFCFKGDGLWESSDEELVALAKREIGKLGLADPARVTDGTVVRMPKAYPIYDAAYSDHLAEVRGHIDPISNLHPVGRNGMHKYNNQDHSMLTAMMTVWNMKGAQHDVWSVNTDFEYHEEQRLDQGDTAPVEPAASAATG